MALDGEPTDSNYIEMLSPLRNAALEAMRSGRSILTPGRGVWTAPVAEELERKFVGRPDESGRSFDQKLDDQLGDASDLAIQLFAELLCLNLGPLADYKPETKRRLVRGILHRMSEPVEIPDDISEALGARAFNGGVSFKTRRPFQLALMVRIAAAMAARSPQQRDDILADPREFATFLTGIHDPNEPSQRHSLAFLLFPQYCLPIVSEKHRTAIREAFVDLLDGTEPDLDAELFTIASRLSGGGDISAMDLYQPPHIDRWDPARTKSGVPVTIGELDRRDEFKTPRYVLATAAIGLVDEGHYTTYSDIGNAVGLIGAQVGQYVTDVHHDNGHRVIKVDRTTYRIEQQRMLEEEGVPFDVNGVADPSRQVSAEDLREELEKRGLLPKVSKRAWLVRGNNVSGKDLVPSWLKSDEVGLAATNLRELEPGVSRDEVKIAVEEDYAHASYAARGEKVDEFHGFLTRMQDGDLVATVDQGRLFLGHITGAPEFREAGDTRLVRDAQWIGREGLSYSDIPDDIAGRLKVQRDLLDLTRHLDTLERLLDSGVTKTPPPVEVEVALDRPTDDLARELHVERAWLEECVDLLSDRPQLIFYGPPGTGKTYLAQKLARFAAGENVQLVQFHASYAYEDFMEGFRPTGEKGFELRPGPMRRIADKALENPGTPYFLIIDEINRGNLAKVFGELYFLLEYRDETVKLLYSDDDFALPKNVFIIGTMNTADRSIALVDAAMRRRFAFLPLHPSQEPTSDILRRWLAAQEPPLPDRAAALLDELNMRIEDVDFKIGPSYFMRPSLYGDDDAGLRRVWRTSILPLLEEHHFGEMSSGEVAARYGYEAVSQAVDQEPVDDASPDPD